MIRSAVLLCTGIIIAMCFGCIPAAQPESGASASVRTGTSTGTGTGNSNCSATDFADAVMVLPANYSVDVNHPPSGSFPTLFQGSSSPMLTDLANAFAAAPQKLQKQLCVTTVFINPTTCTGSLPCFGANSWGFRYAANTPQRYIALSQTLWPSAGSSAEIYSQYETDLLAQVLASLPTPAPWPTSGAPNPPTFETIGTATYNTSAMAILAALTHEYGHILWYDAVKGAGNNNGYVAGDLCRGNRGVRSNGFFDSSWLTITNPATFQNFDGSQGDLHILGNIQTGDLTAAINGQSWTTAVNDLAAYYSTDTSIPTNNNGIWASLFGSISPEEDFVEAFKIFIMTNTKTNNGAPVTSLPLDLFTTPKPSGPTQSPDLYADIAHLKKNVLKKKFDCINGKW